MNENFLESSIKIFEYYKALGKKAMDQVEETKLFYCHNEEINSIATIVKHLHGNMRSRWTDFLTTDGEKDFRDRDGEFVNSFKTREEVYEKYEEGWSVLLDTLSRLTPDDVSKTIYIRNQGHTVLEAIQRQLAHVPYHIGQIIYMAKIIKQDSWESLSIPKGQSNKFNKQHFQKAKHKSHFTDEFMDKK